MCDFSTSKKVMRPCQLSDNKPPLQIGHSFPSTKILHDRQTFFFIVRANQNYSAFAFPPFAGAAFASFGFCSSSAHSVFPRPPWRIVKPSFGFVTSLNETEIIFALHISPTFNDRFDSFPTRILSLPKETKSSIVWAAPRKPTNRPNYRS